MILAPRRMTLRRERARAGERIEQATSTSAGRRRGADRGPRRRRRRHRAGASRRRGKRRRRSSRSGIRTASSAAACRRHGVRRLAAGAAAQASLRNPERQQAAALPIQRHCATPRSLRSRLRPVARGERADAGGVPVRITSPGSSVITEVMNSMMASQLKTMSRVLPFCSDLAVDARAAARARRRIEIGLDARAEGAEGVEALAARELHVLLLQVARGDVVRAGEAEDDVAPVARPGRASRASCR